MIVNWLDSDADLRILLEVLGTSVGCTFDDHDWAAFEYGGLKGTDDERGPWFEYPLGPISVEVAKVADGHLMVRLAGGNAEFEAKAVMAFDILQRYTVRQQ